MACAGQADHPIAYWKIVATFLRLLLRRSWSPRAGLLVLDEIHKMPDWKRWLKGVADARPTRQAVLVTGSARMETFRQGGESLAGRYLALRLHPVSVREWCEQQGAAPTAALTHLLERGGFPEPCLAPSGVDADRWRRQYATDLIREDVVEFSRLHEVNTMRVFFEMLRGRVGSLLSLASMARDLAISPTTLRRYLDVLQALYIVFLVPPWHRNIGRALLQSPKLYFHDTGSTATTACASRTRWPACCSSTSSSFRTPKGQRRHCTTCARRTAPRSTSA